MFLTSLPFLHSTHLPWKTVHCLIHVQLFSPSSCWPYPAHLRKLPFKVCHPVLCTYPDTAHWTNMLSIAIITPLKYSGDLLCTWKSASFCQTKDDRPLILKDLGLMGLGSDKSCGHLHLLLFFLCSENIRVATKSLCSFPLQTIVQNDICPPTRSINHHHS